MRYLLLLSFILLPTLSHQASACTGQTACQLGERSYHVRPPDDWDGVTPLPVLLHFHGWGRQGDLIVRHDRIASGAVAEQVLLVAPNGLRGTWAFRQAGSPDSAFALDVLEDVAKQYPVDPERIFVSGYSYGANMAWRLGCDGAAAGNTDLSVNALLAISGGLSQDETCSPITDFGPREVRQVFGLDDNVQRFPMGPGGDETYPVALWRRLFQCGEGVDEGAWNARPFLTFQRTTWDCPDGRVVLDVHPAGHFIPHGWIPSQVADLLEQQ